MKEIEEVEIFLEYKGYQSKLKYDDYYYSGIIDNVSDLIYYEGKTIESAIKDFQEAINHYIKFKE